MQDLEQAEVYVSSRLGPCPVRSLSLVHCERALAALVREHGAEVEATPLGLALRARAELIGATVVERTAPFGDADGVTLRGSSGRFVASASRALYRRSNDG